MSSIITIVGICKFVEAIYCLKMSKRKIEESKIIKNTFPNFKSYSVEEILAAGGTTAFANKLGKNPENLAERLKQFPEEAFLTEDEFALALETLNRSK